MKPSGEKYAVVRTVPFVSMVEEAKSEHPLIEEDLKWLEPRLAVSPKTMGDKVTGLKDLNLPVYKTRLKDSCCGLSASQGWRIYYAVSDVTKKVFMLFFHHKKDLGNPATKFLQQKIERAFAAGESKVTPS